MPFFASAGYTCHALSFRGHGRSAGRDTLDRWGIADYVDDVIGVVDSLGERPVLVGHSMGGFVALKYLERFTVPATVLLSSVPPQGLWAPAIGLAFAKPGLMTELNRLLSGGRASPEALRDALFAQPVSTDRLWTYYRRMQPESHRAIWDMMLFNLPQPYRANKTSLLVLGAQHDHLIPPTQVELTAQCYGVPAEIFDGLGHGLMLEREWKRVAEHIRDWLIELEI